VILFFIYGLRHETGSNAAKIPGDYWSYTWSVSGIHRSIYSLADPFIFTSDLNVAQWLGRFLIFTSYHKFPFSN